MARAGGRERGADDEFASNFSTASLSLSFHYSPCTASHSFGSWMNCDWRRLRVNKALVQGVSSSSHAAAGGGGEGLLRKCLNRRINWLIEAIIRLLFLVVVSRPWISIYWSTFHIQFPWQMKWICATCALWMDLQMRLQIDFMDWGDIMDWEWLNSRYIMNEHQIGQVAQISTNKRRRRQIASSTLAKSPSHTHSLTRPSYFQCCCSSIPSTWAAVYVLITFLRSSEMCSVREIFIAVNPRNKSGTKEEEEAGFGLSLSLFQVPSQCSNKNNNNCC